MGQWPAGPAVLPSLPLTVLHFQEYVISHRCKHSYLMNHLSSPDRFLLLLFCIFLYFTLCIYMWDCMFHSKNIIQWRSEDHLWELVSFNHVGLRDWIQVIKLGRKCLYSWSQLSGPWQFFLEDKIHKDKDSDLFHFCSQQFLISIPWDLLLKLCLNIFKCFSLWKLNTCIQCVLTTPAPHSSQIMFSFDIVLDCRVCPSEILFKNKIYKRGNIPHIKYWIF